MKKELSTPLTEPGPWVFEGPGQGIQTFLSRTWFDARAQAARFFKADLFQVKLIRGPYVK